MNSSPKSRTATLAFGIATIVTMSLAPASATTVVRDHRDNAPVVRDHRDGAASGGVVVTDNPKPRTVHIKYKNPACLGPFCL
ncbi:MAG: hypothetical protein DI543_03780 [Bradyrhizobium icense]|nr:MAG: hypothetical protein DI543_03780 [Bradyrhizobium icense]